eukprot:5377590-Pyramimonas_sp.AAC.1
MLSAPWSRMPACQFSKQFMDPARIQQGPSRLLHAPPIRPGSQPGPLAAATKSRANLQRTP